MTTERWTDERLDRLASTAEANTEQIGELRNSITELRESSREQRESITELRESIEGQQVTATALLQLAAQHQQKWERSMALHEETDQRFNILLAEIRHLAGRVDDIESQAS
jgi:methyl-accepting chemotaxis protein